MLPRTVYVFLGQLQFYQKSWVSKNVDILRGNALYNLSLYTNLACRNFYRIELWMKKEL